MKKLFERETKKGLLECFYGEGLAFTLNGEKIRQKTMIDIVMMNNIRKNPYYKPALPYLEAGGFAGMWNAQVALHQNEIDLIRAARQEALRVANEKAARIISITLSTRGWGDFEPVKWVGDKDTPDAQILAECRHLLETGHDVDRRNQSDDEILALIKSARDKDEKQKAERAARQKDAAAYIATVSEAVKKAYAACGGDAENLPDDIDHPLYWPVRRYAQALQDANL